ncbi:phosphopantetheine binding protein [Stackebrandtia endophytica]|uniref:Phosphopantetheine binding protein n=1 Tax=Stackebrandtia endophytica TaxID=1496996 RepID=A0A543AVS7_9ACTN|nr:acyl carrier protein [Stackebrandtia endophytica]TQL76693.1 phosphopantetheine binding protein [Stackebrandtia endophytica]
MTEAEFKEALAEFTTKTADELLMSDDLSELGVDSIAVYEFVMKIEDVVGRQDIEVTDTVSNLQDLYDRVLEAAEQHA